MKNLSTGLDVTAILERWVRVGDVIIGEIYSDSKGRFVDGQVVRTSLIMGLDKGIVTTLNSVYQQGAHRDSYFASNYGVRNHE